MQNSAHPLFADVILPLALPNTFTYAVPEELTGVMGVGKRVIVQFGKHKIYSALVVALHHHKPQAYEAKFLTEVLDEYPVVNAVQLRFWQWIKDYYLCTPGEVLQAALPSALKLQSESNVLLNAEYGGDLNALNDKEYLVAEALQVEHVLTMNDIAKILGQKTVLPLVKKLLEKGVIILEEEWKDTYKPRMKGYVRLAPEYSSEVALKELFDGLGKKAPKQLEVLMAFYQLYSEQGRTSKSIAKSALAERVEQYIAPFNALVKKGVLEQYEVQVERLHLSDAVIQAHHNLNEGQTIALKEVQDSFLEKEVVLLHGITGSGKTEIYIRLITEALKKNVQVLYLLPEIALTTQIMTRLQRVFGNEVCVYHSGLNEMERVEVWKKVMGEKGYVPCRVVLGARSALFLPFTRLGLIVVDEEHESSYKQYDPVPRYHARDAAIYLSYLHGSKTLLGSATPSLESYQNAVTGKYGLVNLLERYGGVALPEIEMVDIADETRRKRMKSHFSQRLLDEIGARLEKKEQVILFQNRRGFAPMFECNTCGWVPHCIHCDVSLTYHKNKNELRCHYCGYTQKPMQQCGACGDTNIKMKGFGTEKIEEELALFFPEARINRLDYDSTRSKNAYRTIIGDFEDRKTDILVGTQMVAKGLDFDNVGMVGILSADQMLNQPDFRAYERSYQLMVQVSGRSGRKDKQGKVLVQAFKVGHPLIQHIVNNDYQAFFKEELAEREHFSYPPFHRLIEITLKHKDYQIINAVAATFAADLQKLFGKRVLGPEFPSVSRIRSYYLKTVLLKFEKEVSVTRVKEQLLSLLARYRSSDQFKAGIFQIDVDPQ